MDFTLSTYRQLLLALKQAGCNFLRYEDYCSEKNCLPAKLVVLRHDVDLNAANSLATAKIEAELGIQATYYFRVVPQSNQPKIIQAIAALGHEIGYHYEDMTICDGNVPHALTHFKKQLAYFRTFYTVKTICMHGAPRSKFDGKDLWKTNDYHMFGIIGEPYFDTDFSKILYLTDTGRQWDGFQVSVRDKIPVYQDEWTKQGLTFHTTDEIIQALQAPDSPIHQFAGIMFTTHPQRWTDNKMAWTKELILQTAKNQVKRLLLIKSNKQ